MDISEQLGVKAFDEVQSIICVQPHPDDNEVGAAGTIRQLAENGCRVCFVTVTDGRYGTRDSDVSPEVLIQKRRQEREQSGRYLGVNRQYELGFEDCGDYTERAVMQALLPILRLEKPEMVMTVDPWLPYEAHPDHYKTGRAVAAAVLASGHTFRPEAGPPHPMHQVAFYATSYPNTYNDITAYWEKKLTALLLHKSQFENEEWEGLSLYLADQAQKWYSQLQSIHNDYGAPHQGYAEAFKVLATQQLHFFPEALYS
ncbi:diacetylchitobiose deacetylase [Pullulanibacillus camelliae]|uniref:Diacetylchitobiose deacetylase n=1 Tax=Pullulanibacillus camelliae TaxID=1707096 RepID=A0A8J2VFD0_9BACL|nr:PIG-L deacetylase family protein [Pullulanibacillus camelliae]GGE26666.1 diacetylchitobiose deacetylase [Pullulanibacillus camelliae]